MGFEVFRIDSQGFCKVLRSPLEIFDLNEGNSQVDVRGNVVMVGRQHLAKLGDGLHVPARLDCFHGANQMHPFTLHQIL